MPDLTEAEALELRRLQRGDWIAPVQSVLIAEGLVEIIGEAFYRGRLVNPGTPVVTVAGHDWLRTHPLAGWGPLTCES